MDVCVKNIKNNEDFFDQILDEIKLVKYINKHDPGDKYHLLRLYDYFYYWVEIKRAEPKRGGGEFSYDNQSRRGGGFKSYGSGDSFGRGSAGYEGGYGGKSDRRYDGYGGGRLC